ncbi:MAG: hypothetical protein V1494_03840 [Candidatus Diapherotrites archaeon]
MFFKKNAKVRSNVGMRMIGGIRRQLKLKPREWGPEFSLRFSIANARYFAKTALSNAGIKDRELRNQVLSLASTFGEERKKAELKETEKLGAFKKAKNEFESGAKRVLGEKKEKNF